MKEHVVDKTGWPDGPWMTEPDALQWVDETTGLPCAIIRNDFGALCGYVGVPKGHPGFGQNYNDDRLMSLDVHGGLTFSDGNLRTIFGDDEDATPHYWHGFDCGHHMDLSPGMTQFAPSAMSGSVYRDIDYVKREVRSLAEQLWKMLSPLQHLARAADDE